MVQGGSQQDAPVIGHPGNSHILAKQDELWWCKSHNRRATSIHVRLGGCQHHCCAPGLGGILLPCDCIRLDEIDFDATQNRVYHVEMLIREIERAFEKRGSDTRGYLSFDQDEYKILLILLVKELRRMEGLR
jgi:hypothetical protein